jgi:glycosyltransferase involved in cell wall biosynthesis
VNSLETQPFEIIIVTDDKNYPAVVASVTDWHRVRVIKENLKTYAEFWNRAIELCSGKWIAICNVDDYFLPRGLNSIPAAEAQGSNLVCDAIRSKGSDHVQQTVWRPEELNFAFDLGGANPMTKALWQASGGFPEGIRFADWGLAILMRKTGLVKPYTTSEIRIVYDRGYDRVTLSGASIGADERAEGNEQIRQLAKSLR